MRPELRPAALLGASITAPSAGGALHPGGLLVYRFPMSIHVPEELEVRLRCRAEELGISVDELVVRDLERLYPPKPARRLRARGVLTGTKAVGIHARDIKGHLRGEGHDS